MAQPAPESPEPARPPVEFLDAAGATAEQPARSDVDAGQRGQPLLRTPLRRVAAVGAALAVAVTVTVAELHTGGGSPRPDAQHSTADGTRPHQRVVDVPRTSPPTSLPTDVRRCRIPNYAMTDLASMVAAYRLTRARHGSRSEADLAALRTISSYGLTRRATDSRDWLMNRAALGHLGVGETMSEFTIFSTC